MKRIFLLALALALVACEGETPSEEIMSSEKRIIRVYHDGVCSYIYVDTETGVEYFIYSPGYGAAICPMYNADGTLKINKNFGNNE